MESVYTDSNNNIKISDMTKDDLKDYSEYLKNYQIDYRDFLGNNNTFGVEVEFEGITVNEISNEIDEKVSWKVIDEKDFVKGGEVVSPTLIDHKVNWDDLKVTCEVLNKCRDLYTSDRAGAHVHVGAQGIKNYDNLLKLILLYVNYEDVLYRFGYMDRLNPRSTLVSCANPLSIELACDYEMFKASHSIKTLNNRYDRFHGINFKNLHSLKNKQDKNTVEFRFGNGTTNPILWQNYVNLCLKLVDACKKDLDIEKLEYYLEMIRQQKFNYYGIGKYDLPTAVEFADIVFDNMLDKTNFLKQYIKNNEETKSADTNVYVKKLTR